jgi:hypothetical protein
MELAGYRLGEELGRGGMGVVFRAHDARLGHDVAIKVMDVPFGDAASIERFRRESAAGLSLSGENLVRFYRAGEQGPWLFVVMEHLGGGSLADRLQREGRIAWRDAARLGAGIARGLATIHAAGFVHRDVKPSNVLVDASGKPRLADFGLFRSLDEGAARLTRTNDAIGTVAYMAPEQADGGHADARSDLYALGATIHALVTGRAPYDDGPAVSVLKKKLTAAAPRLRTFVPEASPELEAVVARLLTADPAGRGASAAELAQELDALAGGVGAPRASWRVAAGVAIAVVVLAVAGGFALGRGTVKGPGPPAAPVPAPVTPPTTPVKTPEPPPPPPPPTALRRVATRKIGNSAVGGLACTSTLGVAALASGELVAFSLQDLGLTSRAKGFGITTACAITGDGKTAVSCNIAGTIFRWDVGAEGPRWSEPYDTLSPRADYGRRLTSIAVIPETGTVFAGAADYGLVGYDLETHARLSPGVTLTNSIFTLCAGPGQTIWSADRDGRVICWEHDLEPRWRFAPDVYEGAALAAVGKTGRCIAAWQETKTVRAGFGTADPIPIGHARAKPSVVAISPEERVALTADDQGGLIVWDLERSNRLAEVALGKAKRVLRAAFFSTGNDFLVGTADGAVTHYAVDLDARKKD